MKRIKTATEEATKLPDVPRKLINEADNLFNVTLNKEGLLLEKFSLLYDFLDKVNRTMVSKFASCKKGCSHCCIPG